MLTLTQQQRLCAGPLWKCNSVRSYEPSFITAACGWNELAFRRHFHCETYTLQLHPSSVRNRDVVQKWSSSTLWLLSITTSSVLLFNRKHYGTHYPISNTQYITSLWEGCCTHMETSRGNSKYYCRHGNLWTDEEEMSKTEGGKWMLRNEGEETVNNGGNEISWHDVRETFGQVRVYWWDQKMKQLILFLKN